jgi:hypothetical protein
MADSAERFVFIQPDRKLGNFYMIRLPTWNLFHPKVSEVCDHEFAPEVDMSSYHDVNRAFPATKIEKKLTTGVSVLVIGGLSALCWAILVIVGVAISSVL